MLQLAVQELLGLELREAAAKRIAPDLGLSEDGGQLI